MKIAENTARARIAKMVDEGLLKNAGFVNSKALLGYTLLKSNFLTVTEVKACGQMVSTRKERR